MTKVENNQLFEAASSGDLDGVKAALEAGANLKATDDAQMDALTIATKDAQIGIILYLLENGAKVTQDALMAANMSAMAKMLPIIGKTLQEAYIMQQEPSVGKDANGKLVQAAYKGDVKKLKKALEDGASADAQDGGGIAALRWAARHGHAKTVEILVEAGADVNGTSLGEWTAFMDAAMAGETKLVKWFIDNGAEVNAQNESGANALYFAQYNNYNETVALLEKNGAEVVSL